MVWEQSYLEWSFRRPACMMQSACCNMRDFECGRSTGSAGGKNLGHTWLSAQTDSEERLAEERACMCSRRAACRTCGCLSR